ncbi:MAG TPA: nicotinate phosphoribosyltransferase [Polyangiaceae bacterium LLY-WYZ-15_(1-7)]|nr:nicotinate phosphoribosyltransferase [Sandaracinus sp.]HJK89367.1 nicotinate phosphoribosyltransferase [Polyangiaceae bacterium LLY-WYZ-15_(1-7)]MBJ73310.1 nicotinate phosphoribosyltransferase [Sandaracinus sp.]HJL03876.1 nicotinate phosphoribosyltransferase [Polyangiaceae bacterium LLY-WYZ-15_(1-7)]HJL07612.1 nicotinate phosphoribosyltransferase [Polyangiaceae bacterium LLY-WYZ-15_(1-7)]
MTQPSLALLTDLYQLTMGAGYWKNGLAERRACFHLFFRKNPFGGGYAIAAGLESALDYLQRLHFGDAEIAYLRSLKGADGGPLFEEGWLDFLAGSELELDVMAIPEGTVVFPHEPLLRVEGPLWQAQLVETALLTLVNFETLVATKAARVCRAARGPNGEQEGVLEFGLRRAQGLDGGLSASRAAFVGGCSGTSNVLAGQRFGIPVRGTHAHSWVMTYPTEREAFEAYARAFPNNCIFLVDTYDTLEGVRTAVEVGRELRARGHEMVGVRLDSGDLAALSKGARAILDEGGFPDAKIVASNSLDEYRIEAHKAEGGLVQVWGVGTRLSTCWDQPALGGVYKLAAIQGADGEWEPRIKLSETPIKISIPTRQQVRRFHGPDGTFLADAIYDEATGFTERHLVHPEDAEDRFEVPEDAPFEDLLVPVIERGRRVYDAPPIRDLRARALAQQERLPPDVARSREPARYFAGLEEDVWKLRQTLIEAKERRP